jgi:hypothetical protein
VAAAATQLGCEEHPTTASTSAGPAPTCASRHCKLGGIRNLFRCISERMVYRKGADLREIAGAWGEGLTSGPDLRRTRRPSRAHKPQAALNLPGYPLPSLDPVPVLDTRSLSWTSSPNLFIEFNASLPSMYNTTCHAGRPVITIQQQLQPGPHVAYCDIQTTLARALFVRPRRQ